MLGMTDGYFAAKYMNWKASPVKTSAAQENKQNQWEIVMYRDETGSRISCREVLTDTQVED